MFIGLRALVAKSIGTRLIRLGPASSILTDTAVKVDTGNAVSRETHLRKKKKKKGYARDALDNTAYAAFIG